MSYTTLFLHLHAGCLHLLLMASCLPLLFGLLLFWMLRQRLQQKVRDLEASNAQHHEKWTRAETELAGLKYQHEECVKALERSKASLRSSESENMALRGRLEKAQAKNPAESASGEGENDLSTASLAISGSESAENLQIIEGIGPKVEQILKSAGIANWNELAAQSEQTLRGVLNNAGPAYQMMDPSTWPEQARLASEGRWEALKVLQDELRGGRKL